MKLSLLLLLLLVSGCSILGSKRDIPDVKPVEIVTVVKKAPMYHPNAPTNVWYALTTKGYENLSTNMAEVKRYLRQVLSILKYYREQDKEKDTSDEQN